MDIIYGRNAVKAAIRSGRSIDKLIAAKELEDPSVREILTLAAQHHIPIIRADRRKLDSPVTGSVQEVYFRAGELVPAGRPIVSLLPPGNVRVRFFVPQDRVPSRRNQLANRLSIELVARCASKSVVSKGNYRRFTCCGKVDSTQMRRRTERVERSSWRNSLLSAGRSLATTRRHGPSAASAPDHHPTWPQQYCPANECRQAQFAHPSTRGWPRAGRRSVWPGSLRVSESASVAR